LKEKQASEFDSIINTKPRRLYTIKPNNLFGLKGGIVFTGISLEKAVDKVIDNALPLAFFKVEDQEQRLRILREIKKVTKALTLDTIIIGLNGKKRSDIWVESLYDVEKNDSLRYNDLFYDNERNQCYFYYLDKSEGKWI